MSIIGLHPESLGMAQLKQDLLIRELIKYEQEKAALQARRTSDAAVRARFRRMFRIRQILFRFVPRFAERRFAL